MCVFAKCPQLRCNVVIPHSVYLSFLTKFTEDDNQNYLEKYQQWHCKEFTEENRNIKWCPGKDCGLVVERSDYATKSLVECKCGMVFCFKCGLEDHIPASCIQVEMWKEKEQNDSENLIWIKANTKPCPGCKNFIEKNQGCNHMTCSKCRFEFCWLCLREWKNHGSSTGGYYACNVYEQMKNTDKVIIEQEKIIAESKNELQRYIFHYERFRNHQKSGAICKKQIEKITANQTLLHTVKNFPIQELTFFEECAHVIIKCRQVLSYTYVVGYFEEKSMN